MLKEIISAIAAGVVSGGFKEVKQKHTTGSDIVSYTNDVLKSRVTITIDYLNDDITRVTRQEIKM